MSTDIPCLTRNCVLQEYLNRRSLYLIPFCKANCTPGEVGVCRGRPLPYPYGPEIGFEFTYFSIKKVIYLSTRNEFDTNRLCILKNIEIKNITHNLKNPETLTKEDQIKIQKIHSEYDSKVVSSMQFYLNFARHVACKTEPYSCFLMQDIVKQWFTMHGECYFIRYLAVPQRQQKEDSVDLIACVCSLADYQRMFVTTYSNPLLMKPIDYCWTGAMFRARICDIKSKFENEASNHNRFTEDRLMNASIPLKPENALQVGLKKAVKNPDLMSIFKKKLGCSS